jgi:hypothetical protein
MKLTPGQVREVLDLSADAFRHWKGALPPLCGRNGYRPCYTLGDLLAMAIVKTLTDDVGVSIRYLTPIAAPLFEHCGQQPWAALERETFFLEPLRARVAFASDLQLPQFDGVGIVVPCGPILASLRERLLLEQGDTPQAALRFPPTMLSDEGRRRRAS